jgi:hypothetical protein
MKIFKPGRMKWEEHVARMEREKFIHVIGGKTRRKEPLGRPKRRWVDTIKMDLGEIIWGLYGLD